jgi:hypothetical protein
MVPEVEVTGRDGPVTIRRDSKASDQKVMRTRLTSSATRGFVELTPIRPTWWETERRDV